MPTTQTERIRNLVRISPVLSAAERTEWLSMVDLMNGKQLSDLEHILTAGISRAVVQHGPVPHPAEPRRPQAPNVPGPSSDNPVQDLRPAERPAAVAGSGKFSTQLKRVIDTAEIPSGPEELELPAPRPTPPPRPQPVPPRPAAPPAQAAAPRTNAVPPLPPKPFQPPVPVVPKPQPRVPASSVLIQNPSSSIPQRAQVKPGVPPAVPPVPAPSAPPALRDGPPAAPAGPLPELKSAEDLARLNVSGWRAFPPGAFVRASAAAISRSGLASAVGALEKSPLMQSYIETGLAALGQRAAGGPGGLAVPNLLTRVEFERLSDDLKILHLH